MSEPSHESSVGSGRADRERRDGEGSQLRRVLAQTYIAGRTYVRALLRKWSVLDRVIGNRLRRIERLLPLSGILDAVAGRNSITCNGLVLEHPPGDLSPISGMVLNGEYEPEVTEVVLRSLAPGSVFVDLGANIGYFSLLAARAVQPNGRVYAFEPLPHVANVLAANVRRNGFADYVEVVDRAISDRPGVAEFSFEQGDSISAHIAEPGERNTFTVQVVSLDHFFASRAWPRVDFIKMDVEGAELAAIRGMRELSSRSQNLMLVFEFLHRTYGEAPDLARSLFDTLHESGFRRFLVLHEAGKSLQLPRDLTMLAELSRTVNLNILAQKS